MTGATLPGPAPQAGAAASRKGARPVPLSRDLGEFLIEFSIALNRTVMYPEGHPSLDDAAALVVHRLSALLHDRPSLSLGVARRQLVIDGVATDSANPVLRSLADRLHQQHIGALSFRQGLTPREILATLNLLAAEAGPETQPLGLGPPDRLRVGPHVGLYPLSYERLEMAEDAGPPEDGDGNPEQRSRIASLWIGMARAALARDLGEESEEEGTPVEPAAVARAINEHQGTQAYDQVIVGYLLQIANELKADGGAANAAVRRHLARMIEGLSDNAMDRLLAMGGDLDQRRSFMLDAIDGMAAEAVVDLAQAASRASNRSFSEPLLRVLMKLAGMADAQTSHGHAAADTALRDEVRKLIGDWTAEGATPRYAKALEAAAHMEPPGRRSSGQRDQPEALRMLQMALELEAWGPGVVQAVDDLVSAGEAPGMLGLLAGAGPGQVCDEAWNQLARAQNIGRLLTLESLDATTLERILSGAEPAAVAAALIDAVLAGRIPARHTNALVAMSLLGPQVAAEAGRRLADERASVRRDVLAFLNEFAIVPEGMSPLASAADPDPAVRREALKLALLLPRERERAIGMAITDADERVVRVGARALEAEVPESAIALLAGRAGDPALPTDLRTAIARSLGTVRSPLALDALLRIATAGTNLLGKPRLAPRSAEMLAGLAGLAAAWADEPKAAEVLKRARTSSDPATRAAARAEA